MWAFRLHDQMPHARSTMSFRRFNLFGSNTSIASTRPPTYTSEGAAPSYRPSLSERSVAAWNGSSASAWSMTSDSVFGQGEMDIFDIRGTSADHTGPRYGEFSSRPRHHSLDDIDILSLLQIIQRGWSNSIRKPCLL